MHAPEAISIKSEADKLYKPQEEIGIVLPLSGELQKYGEAILDGAMLMAEKYMRDTGRKLTPLVYDTKGESVEAARIVRRMAAAGANAVIGPLTSEETAVAAAALSCSDLPLIAPAAGQGGLTDLSPTSFQLQPTLDQQGIKMAEFAYKKMNIDTVAIITPTLPDNLRMAEAFARRFSELGGKVLGTEYFRIRETDFGAIIFDLKSIASGGKILDSAIYINENGDTLESKEIPIRIEAIYIPAEATQLRQLLPQINFYNLNAVYLGGEGWADSSVYELDRNIVKTCYFTSSRIANDLNPVFKKFSSDFFDKYGQAPGYLEALGYDAMSLLCNGMKAGAYARGDITRYLTEVKNYNGASGNVSFGENRENIVMPIYTIEGGKPKRADQ